MSKEMISEIVNYLLETQLPIEWNDLGTKEIYLHLSCRVDLLNAPHIGAAGRPTKLCLLLQIII